MLGANAIFIMLSIVNYKSVKSKTIDITEGILIETILIIVITVVGVFIW